MKFIIGGSCFWNGLYVNMSKLVLVVCCLYVNMIMHSRNDSILQHVTYILINEESMLSKLFYLVSCVWRLHPFHVTIYTTCIQRREFTWYINYW